MFTAFFRTLILYIVLMLGLRMLGKRQIANLEPSELVLTLTISDLASIPMQDYGIPLISGLLPIMTLLCMSMIFSCVSLKSVRFRTLICGKPAIIIQDGKILQNNMTKNRLTLDELFEELRTQGYSDLRSIKYAILETNGHLSILPYTNESPLTPRDAKINALDRVTLPHLIINDGCILGENLVASGHDRIWLEEQIHRRNLSSHLEIFLMTVDDADTVVCITKEATR